MILKLSALVFLCLPAWGQIAYVQSAKGIASTGSTVSASFSTPPTVGNLVVVGCGDNLTASTLTAADNQGGGNTYSTAVAQFSLPSAKLFYVVVANSSGTFTVTCTADTSAFLNIFIAEYSGVRTTTPLDQTASANAGGGTGVTSSAFTTTSANEIVIALGVSSAGGNPTTPTADTGFTTRISETNGVANEVGYLMDKIVSSIQTSATVTTLYSSAGRNSVAVGTFIQGTSAAKSVPRPINFF